MGRTKFFVRSISRLLIVGTVAATTLFAFTGTSWASDRTHAAEELSFVNKINAHRADRDLAPLKVNLQLTGVARKWSDNMAAAGGISHNPQLANQVEGDWTRLGENVGYSSRTDTSGEEFVRRLDAAFWASPGHKANVVGDYNQVGVGVRMTGHTMWVTVQFMKASTVVSNRQVNRAATAALRDFTASSASGSHANYVVVTASDRPSHSMGAAVLAGDKGPLLHTHGADSWDESPVLHPRTRAVIDRLLGGGDVIYVVGNAKDVSDKAVRELTSDGYIVKRLTGRSNTATVARVGEETIRRHGANGRVVIGRRGDRVAAADAADWAARSAIPYLVTGKARLHPSVRSFLTTYKPARRWVAGPRRVISRSVQLAADARRIN